MRSKPGRRAVRQVPAARSRRRYYRRGGRRRWPPPPAAPAGHAAARHLRRPANCILGVAGSSGSGRRGAKRMATTQSRRSAHHQCCRIRRRGRGAHHVAMPRPAASRDWAHPRALRRTARRPAPAGRAAAGSCGLAVRRRVRDSPSRCAACRRLLRRCAWRRRRMAPADRDDAREECQYQCFLHLSPPSRLRPSAAIIRGANDLSQMSGHDCERQGLLQACRSEYCRRGAPLTAPRAACQTRRPFRAEPRSASASWRST